MTDQQLLRDVHDEALEARFARRVVSALGEREVGHDVGQRLRVAREQAVGRARHARVMATSVNPVGAVSAALSGPPWWLRLASLAPLVVLTLGMVLINRLNIEEQVHAAAEIDAVLLADELPPAAYSDPGFGEFLKLPSP